MQDVYVINVMTSPVRSVAHDATVREAATVMSDLSIGSVIVNNEQGDAEGILTESDVVDAVAAGRDLGETTAEEIEGSPLITVAASDPLEEAAEKMIENGIKKLPVIDEDDSEVIGIVTTTDLTQYVPHHQLA